MDIYIDNDYKCHVSNDGTMRVFNIPFFDGKCSEFVEGYRYVPKGERWELPNGVVIDSGMISPWEAFCLLEKFQAQYERQLADAEAAYIEGVNSI